MPPPVTRMVGVQDSGPTALRARSYKFCGSGIAGLCDSPPGSAGQAHPSFSPRLIADAVLANPTLDGRRAAPSFTVVRPSKDSPLTGGGLAHAMYNLKGKTSTKSPSKG
ncbi:hypothetical protein MCOR22_009881 [Pyricularia oryzae]